MEIKHARSSAIHAGSKRARHDPKRKGTDEARGKKNREAKIQVISFQKEVLMQIINYTFTERMVVIKLIGKQAETITDPQMSLAFMRLMTDYSKSSPNLTIQEAANIIVAAISAHKIPAAALEPHFLPPANAAKA
jgi:hypothetical protein